ncbi:MAG: XrtA-associated ATPase [Burkholderiaceae bacterium]|nr:XrtA-associated ATPase [Burkholderiaceae bacterium]
MYESYYGLTGKPFQLSPNPDFFFDSRGHRCAMAYLEYGLHQGEGFIVVTGEVGAGKTTLVQRLLQRLPAREVVPVQIVTTQLDADDMLRVVTGSFGLPADSVDKATLLIRLEQHLRQLHSEGRRALLIVDEAQNLGARAIEELRMLSNFQIDSRTTLQCFLIGQPELRELMQRQEMRQLKQRIIAAYHLGPLGRDETRRYIEHRLGHVGWKSDPAFEERAFEHIFAATGGIPRRINTLVDRVLLAAYLAEKHLIAADDVVDVADEQSRELGPRRGFLGAAPGADAPEDPSMSRQAAPARTGAEGVSRGSDESPSSRLDALENRVAILESAAGMMFGSLKKVLRILRMRTGERELS